MATKATSNDSAHSKEDYEFCALPSVGKFNVANHAHGSENVTEHTYTVSLTDGRAARCTCLADTYHAEPCKHRDAVEGRDDFERQDGCSVCGGTGVSPSGADCFACVRPGGDE